MEIELTKNVSRAEILPANWIDANRRQSDRWQLDRWQFEAFASGAIEKLIGFRVANELLFDGIPGQGATDGPCDVRQMADGD